MQTAEYNGLPLFKATFPEESDGIIRVSLVDYPAVQSDFMCFNAQTPKSVQMYAVANEEKRLVRGVILRADYPIYRFEHGFEYYVTFGRDEIKDLAERYLYDGRQNRVNLQHQPNSDVAGVHLRQIFIKDTENGISPKGFEDIEDGSLFGEYHVLNDEVWEEVKAGTYRGFSVEIMGCAEADVYAKTTKNQSNMSIKSLFKKLMVNLAAVNTDKGMLLWDGEEDLKQGDAVYIEENGERKDAPDGDYTTEDGKVIKVVDGKVAELVDPEAEVAEEETTEEAEQEQMAEEVAEEVAEEAGTKNDEDELWAMFNELAKRVEALEAEVKANKERADEMRAEFEKFAKAPAGVPAHEEFKEHIAKPSGNPKVDRASAIVSARRK